MSDKPLYTSDGILGYGKTVNEYNPQQRTSVCGVGDLLTSPPILPSAYNTGVTTSYGVLNNDLNNYIPILSDDALHLITELILNILNTRKLASDLTEEELLEHLLKCPTDQNLMRGLIPEEITEVIRLKNEL